MAISKDEQYRIYNFGIEEGREIVKDYIDDEDIIDIFLEAFTNKQQIRRIEDSDFDELKIAVNNFRDGIEDGMKSQLSREADVFVRWLEDNI